MDFELLATAKRDRPMTWIGRYCPVRRNLHAAPPCKLRDHSDTTVNKRKTQMNSMRSRMYLPMMAMILTTLAVAAAAQNRVPFVGSIQGQEINTPQGGPPPTTLLVNGS